MLRTTYGERLIWWMKKRGVTRVELAFRTKRSTGAIHGWLHDVVPYERNRKTIERLSKGEVPADLSLYQTESVSTDRKGRARSAEVAA